MCVCVCVCVCVHQCECYFLIFIFFTQEASLQKFHNALIFIKHNDMQEILKQAIVLYFVCQALQSPVWGRLDLGKPYLSLCNIRYENMIVNLTLMGSF